MGWILPQVVAIQKLLSFCVLWRHARVRRLEKDDWWNLIQQVQKSVKEKQVPYFKKLYFNTFQNLFSMYTILGIQCNNVLVKLNA